MWRVLCVHIIALGCGHAAGPPPAPPPGPPPAARADAGPPDAPLALEDDLPRLAARALQLSQAWAHALADAGEDCAKATANVEAVAAQYTDVLAANLKVLHAGRDKVKALREAVAAHQAEFDAAGAAIAHSKAMAACAGDPAFARAIDHVGGSEP